MFVFSRLYCIRDRMVSTIGEVSLVHLQCVECVVFYCMTSSIKVTEDESDWCTKMDGFH